MYKMSSNSSNNSPRFRGPQNAYVKNPANNGLNIERMMAGNFGGSTLRYKASALGQGILDNHARVMNSAVEKDKKYIAVVGQFEPEMYLVTVTETQPDIKYKITKRIINGEWKDIFMRSIETAGNGTYFYETTPRSAANASRKSRKQRKNRKGTRKNYRRN